MSREPLTTAIPRFSVSRPVTVVMLLATIIVVGYIAYDRIRLSLFPEDLEGNQLHVSVTYPNASPRDIEEKITRKIEDIIGTVPDVSRITSYASPSSSYTRIEFRTGTRLREAYAAVSDRMDRVKLTMIAQGAIGAQALGIAILTWTGVISIGSLLVFEVIGGIAASFDGLRELALVFSSKKGNFADVV